MMIGSGSAIEKAAMTGGMTLLVRLLSLLLCTAMSLILIGCSSPVVYIKTASVAADFPTISFNRIRNAMGSSGPSYTLVDLGDNVEYNGEIVLNTSINPYAYYRDTGKQIRNIEYLRVDDQEIIRFKTWEVVGKGSTIRGNMPPPDKPVRKAQVVGMTGSGSDGLTWKRPPGTMKLVVVSPHVEAACALGDTVVEAGKSYLVEFDSAYGSFNVSVKK